MRNITNCKRELNEIVKMCIKDVTVAFKRTPFSQEKEVQWYLQYQLIHQINEFFKKEIGNRLVLREYQTRSLFIRKGGLLEKAPQPVPGKKRTHGYIDLVILDSISHGKELIGIEVEYPLGDGLTEEQYFRNHIINDCVKLNDLGEGVDKYLLCFVMRRFSGRRYENDELIEMWKPEINNEHVKHIWETESTSYCSGINSVYVEFYEKEFLSRIKDHVVFPSDWLPEDWFK